MMRLAQPGDGLGPTKNFLDALAPPLAERVVTVPAGALVDRAGLFLRRTRH